MTKRLKSPRTPVKATGMVASVGVGGGGAKASVMAGHRSWEKRDCEAGAREHAAFPLTQL
jgi:hypothetical protein